MLPYVSSLARFVLSKLLGDLIPSMALKLLHS